nr:hypothetical protein [Tanacetum cinerariifolium]
MPPRRRQPQPSGAPTNSHVDPREDMNKLRRQVKILTERLTQLEPHHEEEEFELDDAFENSFHRHVHHQEPPIHHRWEAIIKFEILYFPGTLKVEDFIDWLNTVEGVFEFKDVPENKKGIKSVEEYTKEFYELLSCNEISYRNDQLISRTMVTMVERTRRGWRMANSHSVSTHDSRGSKSRDIWDVGCYRRLRRGWAILS